MHKLLSILLFVGLCSAQHQHATSEEPAKVAGTWQMSMDSPHGTLHGPFKIEQDGAKLTASFEVEGMGSFPMTGKVDATKIVFNLDTPGGQMTLTGTVESNKMSGKTSMDDGAW